MLNFEEEMKAVKKGYVVLSIDEYDSLRDQIAAANMRAYEAEQLANRRIADMFRIERRVYGDHNIEIVFNERIIHATALDMLHQNFSAEELDGYVIKSANDMYIMDVMLAQRKPDDELAADE